MFQSPPLRYLTIIFPLLLVYTISEKKTSISENLADLTELLTTSPLSFGAILLGETLIQGGDQTVLGDASFRDGLGIIKKNAKGASVR